MYGIMLVLEPNGETRQREFTRKPNVEIITAEVGGGNFEQVPGFNSIIFEDGRYKCVAVHRNDKRMRLNLQATKAWHVALRASGHGGLVNDTGVVDYLVGPVVI